jgi:hypothetical protein
MPNPSATPTPITPPRVPFIDARTGLIDRAWYQFFLSLYRVADVAANDGIASLGLESLIASYDAALHTQAQEVHTHPPSELGSLQQQIDALRQNLETQPNSLINDIAQLQSQIQALQVTPPPREFKRSRYGQFLDTTSQIPAAINTPYAVTFDTTDVSNGVYIGSPTSRVYVDERGIYNFLFSIQLDKTTGGVGLIWIWPRINGVDVPNSNSQLRLQGNNNEQLATIGYFFKLNAGDYVEVMYAVDDVTVQLTSFASSAFYPAVPSIILTVSNNIEGVQ